MSTFSTSQAPSWTWDPGLRLYQYYDNRTGQYVYSNGLVSRTPLAPAQTAYSSSPSQRSDAGRQSELGADPYAYKQRYSTVSSAFSTSPAYYEQYPAPWTPYLVHERIVAQPLRSRAQSSQSVQNTIVQVAPSPIIRSASASTGVPAQMQYPPWSSELVIQGPQSWQGSRKGSVTELSSSQSRQPAPDRSSSEALLSDQFKVRPRKFFTVGRVMHILWAEPLGGNGSQSAAQSSLTAMGATKGRFGEQVWSKIRAFVVVREGERHCLAIPITTYAGQGVAKTGVKKSEHGIIYTGTEVPNLTEAELPSRAEKAMLPYPIRVIVDQPGNKLDPMSRLDYAKVHTVSHDFKVKPFGNVHTSSISHLLMQFSMIIDPYYVKRDEPSELVDSRHDSGPPGTREQAVRSRRAGRRSRRDNEAGWENIYDYD